MKWFKVFSVFILIHALLWGGAHLYRSANPSETLIGVDTSFGLKSSFPAMRLWIEGYEAGARYESITIATDKSMLGPLDEIASRESIFRTAFGRSQAADFEAYRPHKADKRLLLSDGSFVIQDWELVRFD